MDNSNALVSLIKEWGKELGFSQMGITTPEIKPEIVKTWQEWLNKNYAGGMDYLKREDRLAARFNPANLLPGIKSVIVGRMNYLPPQHKQFFFDDPAVASIALFALGRDYHKILRERLNLLAQKIQQYCREAGGWHEVKLKVFAGSAPVLEKYFASKAGLGFIGKNTLLVNNLAGSFFVLGGIYADLELPSDEPLPQTIGCGTCQRCLTACPTRALHKPYCLNATRCIAYLTIENKGDITADLGAMMKNKIFGCDECQKACPFNRFAKAEKETENPFLPLHDLVGRSLVELEKIGESEFLRLIKGTGLERIKYSAWRRNILAAIKGSNPYYRQ